MASGEQHTRYTEEPRRFAAGAGGSIDGAATDTEWVGGSIVSSIPEDGPAATADSKSLSLKRPVRWWILAGASALTLIGITTAAIYLLTKKPSTLEQLVILTVPSGAEITINSKSYGSSPVKIQPMKIGTYTLTITKDGFEPVIQQINVTEPQLEFKLRPLPPSETIGLPAEEAVRQYEQRAAEALERGNFGVPYDGSALYYADLVLDRIDQNNQFALDMRERVRKAAHQAAQSAQARGDSGQAQEIYSFLVSYYPADEEARAAAARLENQLSARRGEVNDLVRKARESLQAGMLTEPFRSSAYYYAKQALAIDRQNKEAKIIRGQVREKLWARSEQLYVSGNVSESLKQLEQSVPLFPEDKQMQTRLHELESAKLAETKQGTDAVSRRVNGLATYREENFREAIPDLEATVNNGNPTPEVLFALGRSYQKTGQPEKAEAYFLKIQPSSDDSYRSAIASLGDIAAARGDTSTAVERYKEAKRLGGSTMYSVATLDDKVDKIERRERERAAEPSPLTIHVRHPHGALRGSCSGPLTVSSTGVRYDGGEHVYSANLVGVGVRVAKDEMIVQFQSSSVSFKASRGDAEHFRETLARFQQYAASGTNR
jgi:PEGA domain-containing protein